LPINSLNALIIFGCVSPVDVSKSFIIFLSW